MSETSREFASQSYEEEHQKARSEILAALNQAKIDRNDAEYYIRKAENSGLEEDHDAAEKAMEKAESSMDEAKRLREQFQERFGK